MKRQDLINAMNNISPGDEAKERFLDNALNYAHEKECYTMSKKKIFIIAIAAVFIISAGAYASGGMIQFSSSSGTPEYTSVPSSKEIAKEIGYSPKIIEAFSNGYIFDNASIRNNSLRDESGKDVEKYKAITMRYKKADDELILSTDPISKYDSELEGNIIASDNGIDFYYSSYMSKSVPPDYEMTEEDKKAEQNGDLIFSYGASEVSVSKVQGLHWIQDNLMYGFLQINGALSPDELVEMAKEITNNDTEDSRQYKIQIDGALSPDEPAETAKEITNNDTDKSSVQLYELVETE